ncbi:unnamed protein product [Heterobilharzia americana]|nr:unnamed protein product [Heterobilharzia americana]
MCNEDMAATMPIHRQHEILTEKDREEKRYFSSAQFMVAPFLSLRIPEDRTFPYGEKRSAQWSLVVDFGLG